MSGGLGPGRRGSYHSRTGGSSPPSGPRRPGRGGSDNVLPLITGVLGSSILAFSLYVFSQKPGVFGADANHPTVVDTQQESYVAEQMCSVEDQEYSDAQSQPCPYHAQETPRIKIEKRRWPTEEEEAIIRERERVAKDPSRSKLQEELKEHLRKVKELTEELEKDEKARGRWSRHW